MDHLPLLMYSRMDTPLQIPEVIFSSSQMLHTTSSRESRALVVSALNNTFGGTSFQGALPQFTLKIYLINSSSGGRSSRVVGTGLI